MKDFEILKMVFELHHRQLAESQARIHELTERTVAMLTLVTGWVILGSALPSRHLRGVLALSLMAIALSACALHWFYHRGYSRIARVISGLNSHFDLYEESRYGSEGSVYPHQWRTFGLRPLLRSNIVLHWVIIGLVCSISIVAILSR